MKATLRFLMVPFLMMLCAVVFGVMLLLSIWFEATDGRRQ